MKRPKAANIALIAAKRLGGCVAVKHCIYVTPCRHTVAGLWLEWSPLGGYLYYINYFVIPMCVPTTYVYSLFGGRDSGSIDTDSASDAADAAVAAVCDVYRGAAMAYWSKHNSPHGVLANCDDRGRQRNPQVLRAAMYMELLCGRCDRAEMWLARVRSVCDHSIEWNVEVLTEMERLQERARRSKAEALNQLQQWEQETATALGIAAHWAWAE